MATTMSARRTSLVLCACLLSGWLGDVLPARCDENRPSAAVGATAEWRQGDGWCDNVTNAVAKRSAATTATTTVAVPRNEATTMRRPSANVKAATTTRKPPSPAGRPRASGTTRPAKPKNGRNHTAATTVWPKPDKRLGGGKLAEPAPPPNRTANNSNLAARTMPVDADFKAKYPTDMWKDHGFYTDDYVRLINGHWFKFIPPGPTAHYVLAVLYTVIMVFGCSGNFLVIFMYIKSVY